MVKFFRRYARKSRKSTSRKPSVKKAIRLNANKIFRKKVLSVIHRNTENKMAYTTTGDAISYFIGNTSVGGLGNLFNPMPNITRGTNEGDRIGNQIKPLRYNVKGYLFYKPGGVSGSYNFTQSRIAVRMMVVAPKQFNNSASAGPTGTLTWFNQLLQKGNTTVAFTGKISDLHASVNKDGITVYSDRTYYMSMTQVNQATAVGYYQIDNSKGTKFFNINIPVKKTLMYDDNVSSGLQPINFTPQILIGWCYLDGSSIGTLADVGISYDSTLTFEDA